MAASILGSGLLCAAQQPGPSGLGERRSFGTRAGNPQDTLLLTGQHAMLTMQGQSAAWGHSHGCKSQEMSWLYSKFVRVRVVVQALMHLLLDLGELGATLFILWRCLHAYQPLALGWFRARIRPLRSWLCPALLACAFFPLVDLAAARSQVRHLHPPAQSCLRSCVLGAVHAMFPGG